MSSARAWCRLAILTRASTRGAALALALMAAVACTRPTAVEVFVDGFEPENVRFEVEELGARSQEELGELSRRGDIDGLLLLPPGSCAGPCRAAIVSIFVHNRGGPEAPPVVRLKSPPGKASRAPIAFRGGEIDHGRVGRIRWIVELWPEETRLTATISSSVMLVSPPPEMPPPPAPSPAAPGGAPTKSDVIPQGSPAR